MVLDNHTYTRKNVMSINRGITTSGDQFPYVSLSHTHTHTHCFQGVEMDTNGVPRQKVGGVRLTPWLTWGSLRGKDSALHAHALTPALRKHWICPGCKTKIIGGCDLVLQDKNHWWVWSCVSLTVCCWCLLQGASSWTLYKCISCTDCAIVYGLYTPYVLKTLYRRMDINEMEVNRKKEKRSYAGRVSSFPHWTGKHNHFAAKQHCTVPLHKYLIPK